MSLVQQNICNSSKRSVIRVKLTRSMLALQTYSGGYVYTLWPGNRINTDQLVWLNREKQSKLGKQKENQDRFRLKKKERENQHAYRPDDPDSIHFP